MIENYFFRISPRIKCVSAEFSTLLIESSSPLDGGNETFVFCWFGGAPGMKPRGRLADVPARLRPPETVVGSRADAKDDTPPTAYEDAEPWIEGEGTCDWGGETDDT
jgi:hypothetical protein